MRETPTVRKKKLLKKREGHHEKHKSYLQTPVRLYKVRGAIAKGSYEYKKAIQVS